MKKRFNISAVIYDKRGRVLAVGKNSYFKTHPLQKQHAENVGLCDKIFLHAEIHAISKCYAIKKAHRIVVRRYDANGNPRNAKPCPVCMDAIRTAGIKHIEHT